MIEIMAVVCFMCISFVAVNVGVHVIRKFDTTKSVLLSLLWLLIGGVLETIGIVYGVISMITLFTLL